MEGKCAECLNENIDYGDSKLQDNSLGYEYKCSNCGHNGIEWYGLEYEETV